MNLLQTKGFTNTYHPFSVLRCNSTLPQFNNHTHTHTHTHAHTRTHARTHTHTHIHTLSAWVQLPWLLFGYLIEFCRVTSLQKCWLGLPSWPSFPLPPLQLAFSFSWPLGRRNQWPHPLSMIGAKGKQSLYKMEHQFPHPPTNG